MDNIIVTHFMQLNAEWSFFGSLVIFRQELVILTDLKYPCLYILSVYEKLPALKFQYFGKYIIQIFGYYYVHVSGKRQTGLER